MNENTKKANELLKNKSVVVNHANVTAFVEALRMVGLNPQGGADLGEQGQIIYF